MATKRYFGTDGIRGRVGDFPMTPEFVLKLGWAVGRVLAADGRQRVLIGKDTRISGYMLESAMEAGLSAAGVNISLLGPMPTPGIAYLTRTLRASAGIVISASHNPYYDNGLKFFSAQGAKLPDELEYAIEAELEQPMVCVESPKLGKAERIHDAAGRYIEFCKSTIPAGTMLRGLRIVVDCAHGATYHIAPEVFEELGAEVIHIGTTPNGLNINDNCGAVTPQALQRAVIQHQADVGVALDGDGDRLIMVDSHGEVVDGDVCLYLIARARMRDGLLVGGVVGTLMSNLGLEHALADLDIPFRRAAVGDRYVLELMQQQQWTLGGETSGHIICLDRTTTGDAIIAALQVLYVLISEGKDLYTLKQGMPQYPQTLINVRLVKPVDVKNTPVIEAEIRDAERDLGAHGRVLLRPSGTEPLIRVMVEGKDGAKVQCLAERIAARVTEVTQGSSQDGGSLHNDLPRLAKAH